MTRERRSYISKKGKEPACNPSSGIDRENKKSQTAGAKGKTYFLGET